MHQRSFSSWVLFVLLCPVHQSSFWVLGKCIGVERGIMLGVGIMWEYIIFILSSVNHWCFLWCHEGFLNFAAASWLRQRGASHPTAWSCTPTRIGNKWSAEYLMASTGRASSGFPGLLLQGLPQRFLTPWSVFVLEWQAWAWSQVGGSLGILPSPWSSPFQVFSGPKLLLLLQIFLVGFYHFLP